MQNSVILGETNNNYIVCPVQYSNETGKIIPSSEKIKSLKKEFTRFEDALEYGNSLKSMES